MLAIAGQTAGPNWLKFCEETYWWAGVILAKKTVFSSSKFEISIFPKVASYS